MRRFRLEDISEVPADELLPPLDRAGAIPVGRFQKQWVNEGVVHLPGFMDPKLIDAYCKVREQLGDPRGWRSATPYMDVPEIKDLGLHPILMRIMKELIGDDMGMHLNLTGWVSTERNWHQDDYLNPPNVMCHYAAVWFALDDIHPFSGPFQYVPGSHKWPLTRRDKLLSHYPPDFGTRDSWPAESQGDVSICFEEEAVKRQAGLHTYVPRKGDVLIWHSRLMHRGSPPKAPGLVRKSLICHYSALSKRTDMPKRAQHTNGSWYFVLNNGTTLGDR